MGEDDILPNCIDITTMEKLNRGIMLRGGEEMHESTLKVFIHLFSPLGSLVVTMNSSIGMSFWLFFVSFEPIVCVPSWLKYYFLWLFCKKLHLKKSSIGHNVFVMEPNNDVYEEVVKPFLEKSKLDLEIGVSTQPPPNLPPEKRVWINFDCE